MRCWLTSRTLPQAHARSKAQQTVRRCAKEYWQNLCAKIQLAVYCSHAKMMYEGIKTATGPTRVKTAPLKSKTGEAITDQSIQLQRLVEHYLELYSTQNIVTDTALNVLPGLPVIDELDNTPTLEELSIAIDGLACGKSPGKDAIPPDVLMHGKQTILQPLHELLCLCWEQGHIPQDIRDASILTMYKYKGHRSDCNNYRGIPFLSIVGKVFARVTLTRLKSLASQVYPESQCGFRAGRSTVDMIFSLRELQEKCREQQQPLFLAFPDITKAFDSVSRSGLFKILQKIGCPPKLLAIITSFHQDMQSTVCFDGVTSNAFPVSSGVTQGCVLSPALLGIFFSMLLQYAFVECTKGVYVQSLRGAHKGAAVCRRRRHPTARRASNIW